MSHHQTGAFVMTKPRLLLIYCLIAAIWSLKGFDSSLSAAEAQARIEAVNVGFRGVVEAGRWTSISMRVTGTPGVEITPRVTAADPEGRPVRQPGPKTKLSETATVISMVYQHGPLDSPVVVELLQGEEVLDERTLHTDPQHSGPLQTVTQLTDFVVCLGDSLLGFEIAAQSASEIRQSRSNRVAPLLVQNYSAEQLSELPSEARGWESVDVCVITANCVISDELGSLLKQWVHQGGRLVLIGGDRVTSITAPGLASWLPVKLDGEMTLRDITDLNGSIPGSATLRLKQGSVNGVRWQVEAGAGLTTSTEGPIVVRTGESLGTVTAIALDINATPFVHKVGDQRSLEWEFLPDLCRWLAGLPVIPKLTEKTLRPQSDLNPTGVSDLQTQLVNTLDSFPEVQRPSYWAVLGTALVFVLIVGPLDYLLVHRWLKRPHWTWLTLPIWIALGGVVGLSAAARTGGQRELIRQLDLATWDAESHEVQVDSWLTIYSPEHRRFEVSCTPGLMDPLSKVDSHIRWAGRPEAGFRGLYRSTDLSEGAIVEQSEDGRSVQSLPIRHGSTSVLEAKLQWEQVSRITNDLYENADGLLKGSFSHQFDGELVDWVLAYGSFAYLPTRNRDGSDSPLQAGTVVRIDSDQTPSRILADYLVRLRTRTVLRQDRKSMDYAISRENYDPLGRDLYTLLRTATFHEVVGGTAYTGLTNSTLQIDDLTRLVKSKRAVVFGRWRNPAYGDPDEPVESVQSTNEPLVVQYTVDGKSVSPRYRECFVRWILPVKPGASPSPAP